VPLAEYLEKVWEVVGRTALEQVLGSGAGFQPAMTGKMPVPQGSLEEDARLTALFLWTLQSTNGNSPSPSPSPARGEGIAYGAPARGEGVKLEDNSPARGVEEAACPEGVEEAEGDAEEEEAQKTIRTKGYSLVFDVVRRFAQPLGIHLEDWEGRIIETQKGVVRLLTVAERAKQLFGDEGAEAVADKLEQSPTGSVQLTLFAEGAAPKIKGRGRRKKGSAEIPDEKLASRREATTLDRIHAAMLLQADGRANALRALLKAEQERGPDFLRLANALSALYPKDSEEKRLLDAMLLAVPRG
jgi:hypothetical protein